LSQPVPFRQRIGKRFGSTPLVRCDQLQAKRFLLHELLGWKESYDEGSQNELMIGDIGDAIVRGSNPNDPNLGERSAAARMQKAEDVARESITFHSAFLRGMWTASAELEKRELNVSVDTSGAPRT
jgi:hypothetical protein